MHYGTTSLSVVTPFHSTCLVLTASFHRQSPIQLGFPLIGELVLNRKSLIWMLHYFESSRVSKVQVSFKYYRYYKTTGFTAAEEAENCACDDVTYHHSCFCTKLLELIFSL
jgi:hypothetical protein